MIRLIVYVIIFSLKNDYLSILIIFFKANFIFIAIYLPNIVIYFFFFFMVVFLTKWYP